MEAQVTASVSGNIVDASGGAIAGVEITVTSLETGGRRTTTTDSSGNYNVSALPLGSTEVRASKAGFKPVDRTGIRLDLDQNARVNFRLEIGAIVSQINVSEQAPLLTRRQSPSQDWLEKTKSRNCR